MGKKRIAVEKMTEGDVLDALEAAHPTPEQWVFLRHVTNATSFSKTRTADAMAMSCWESNGIHLHGYEVKVSRSDWLKEIQQTNKAAEFTGKCHYWWIAAPDGVADLSEMPENWGLKIVTKTESGWSVRVKKAATFNSHATMTYQFFAAALRNCYRSLPEGKRLIKELQAEYERGRKNGEESSDRRHAHDRVTRELKELRDKIEAFEKASGIDINRGWNGPHEVGRAVKAVLKGGTALDRMERVQRMAENMLEEAKKAIADIGGKPDGDSDGQEEDEGY